MLYANDGILIYETIESLGQKLIESKGSKISSSNAKYLVFNFGLESRGRGNSIEIEGIEVPQCEAFRYLGYIIQNTGAIREYIDCMIKAD